MSREEITAGELVARLNRDPEYVTRVAREDAETEERERMLTLAERPVVTDLRRAGVMVKSAWDLIEVVEPYPEALPVLVAHLQRGGYPDEVVEGLARALAVPEAVAWWDSLKALYLAAGSARLQESLAVTLAAAADEEHLPDVYDFITSRALGPSRIFFLRPLRKIGGDAARIHVESLFDDPEIGAEAQRLAHRRGGGGR